VEFLLDPVEDCDLLERIVARMEATESVAVGVTDEAGEKSSEPVLRDRLRISMHRIAARSKKGRVAKSSSLRLSEDGAK
jgi:hypothetical protein